MRRVIVRLDDLGAMDRATMVLVEELCAAGLRLTCGVVPAWLTRACRDFLLGVSRRHPGQLEIHQHGYRHANYGDEARKYEFDASRSDAQQRAELERGRDALAEAFGCIFWAAFSPPFGAYDLSVRQLTREAGFLLLSGLYGDDDERVLPTVSPHVDVFRWDPVKPRSWSDIEYEWQTTPGPRIGGIVLHPRFTSASLAHILVARLPALLERCQTVTLQQVRE
ncbi:MAG: polysaccharide deacetylase family protein [Egibacteraceae bacterium]